MNNQTDVPVPQIQKDIETFMETLMELCEYPHSASLSVKVAMLKDVLRSYGFTPQEIADMHQQALN